MAQLHDLLEEVRERNGIRPTDLSRKIGRSPSYYRKLIETEGTPSASTLASLATALDMNVDLLIAASVGGQSITAAEPPARGDVSEPIAIPNVRDLPKDVPVFGTASGSVSGDNDGAWQLGTDPVDYVRRPPGLLSTKIAYALFIENYSMVPKYEPGELIYVNPVITARPGDYVVIQVQHNEHAEREAYIKRLVKNTSAGIICEQFNPAKNITFPAHALVHRVMPTSELMSL